MKKTNSILSTAALTLISLLVIMPFYIMFVMGTHYSEDLFKGIVIIPGRNALENLMTVLKNNFFKFYWNSIYVAVITTCVSVFISSMTGYALAKHEFKFRKTAFYFIVMTMMIPHQLGLVAFVIQMRYMGLTNTHIPLFLQLATNAFGVFWMTQYIKSTVPTDVIESARIDGCNEFRVFLQVILPYIKPAISTLSMLVFLWSWNNFLLPLIILNKVNLLTIPLGIMKIGQLYRVDYGARLLALSIATIPIVIIFVAGSKTFVRGLTAGAVKG